jgi:hypothetical protein
MCVCVEFAICVCVLSCVEFAIYVCVEFAMCVCCHLFDKQQLIISFKKIKIKIIKIKMNKKTYLTQPEKQPEYRRGRDHLKFIATLKSYHHEKTSSSSSSPASTIAQRRSDDGGEEGMVNEPFWRAVDVSLHENFKVLLLLYIYVVCSTYMYRYFFGQQKCLKSDAKKRKKKRKYFDWAELNFEFMCLDFRWKKRIGNKCSVPVRIS